MTEEIYLSEANLPIYYDTGILVSQGQLGPNTWETTCQICGADVSGPIDSPVFQLCIECRKRIMRALYGGKNDATR